MDESLHSKTRVQQTETRKWITYAGEEYGEAKLTLFFDFPDTAPNFHFDLIELEPIYDDKGKCVFNSAPPGAVETLKEQFRIYGAPRIFDDHLGKHGPLLDLALKSPARGALSLRRIKGVVGVGGGAWNTLQVPLSVLKAGKTLERPELVGLRLTPSVRKVPEGTIITLKATGVLSRLQHWSLGSLDYERLETKLIAGGKEENYLVSGKRLSEKTTAEFIAFTPQHRYLFPFDLQDAPLP